MTGCGKMSAHRIVCQSVVTYSAKRMYEGACQCANGSVRLNEMFVNAFFERVDARMCGCEQKCATECACERMSGSEGVQGAGF